MYKEIMSYEVVVLRNFEMVMGINSSLFDPQNLAKYHGDTMVDIVTQDAKANVMDRSPKSLQLKSTKRLADFVEYQASKRELKLQ